MNPLISPFGFKRTLKVPSFRLHTTPMIDMAVIAIFLILLGSRFLFAPGLSVRLPKSEASVLQGAAVISVVTIFPNQMVLFNDGIYNVDTFGSALESSLDEAIRADHVILLKVDQAVEMQSFFTVVERIRAIGFKNVQIAAETDQRDAMILDF